MVTTLNSSQTNKLLRGALGREPQTLAELFARHQERLRAMIRLRLDPHLRRRFTTSAVLQEVYRAAAREFGDYLANPDLPFFLWLRRLTGRQIQALHREHLGDQLWAAGQELSLYRGSLPEAHAASLAGQLLGQRPAGAAPPAALQVRLQDALNGMDPLDREILALRNFEDLNNDEAATVLGIPPAEASHNYVRALKRLSDVLSRIPGFFA